MKIWISPYLQDLYLGGKKPEKRWKTYLKTPFHLDRVFQFLRVGFICLKWK